MRLSPIPIMLPMTREQHLRRVVLLCCHFARNLAYYRAGWDGKVLRKNTEFWKTMNGNCIDFCVLEWCKLHGEPKGEHHWSQVVSDVKGFETNLYASVGVDADGFEQYRLKVRDYRDKFVAHLDLNLTAYLPHLDPAWASVRFYHAYVVGKEAPPEVFKGLPLDIDEYEAKHSAEALAVYAS